MPKVAKGGKVKQDELPSTLKNSGKKAQETYAKAYDSAAKQYGDEKRSHRVAFAALKHTHEKVGDSWRPKKQNGPSDAQAEGNKNTHRRTAGGVDANASKEHLKKVAKELDVTGRSSMSKSELVAAIQKANDRATAKSRDAAKKTTAKKTAAKKTTAKKSAAKKTAAKKTAKKTSATKSAKRSSKG